MDGEWVAGLFVLVLILCANNCLIVSGSLALHCWAMEMEMATHISYANPFPSINWQPSAAAPSGGESRSCRRTIIIGIAPFLHN